MVHGKTSCRKVFEILDLMFEEVVRYKDRLLYVFRPADQSHVLQLVRFRLNLHEQHVRLQIRPHIEPHQSQ